MNQVQPLRRDPAGRDPLPAAITLRLLDEREEERHTYRVTDIRPAEPGELLAHLDDECVSVAGSRIGGLQVIVQRA
jgi:hypothetical protein